MPAGRNAHVRQSKHSLNRGPLSQIIAFNSMADVLEDIAADERRGTPVPLIPRQRNEQNDARDRQGYANQMNPEIEGMLMAFQPIAQGTA